MSNNFTVLSSVPTSSTLSTTISTSSSSSSAASPTVSPWSPGRECLNLDLSNPPSLNYSSQLLPRVATDLRRITCVAPGCAIIQTYNISGSGLDDIPLNVTDSADVKRRCEAAGGEPEWLRDLYSGNGEREIQHYCVVRSPNEVQGVVGNMTGAERANLWCSTQAYTRRSGASRKGMGMMALGAVLLGSLAPALMASI